MSLIGSETQASSRAGFWLDVISAHGSSEEINPCSTIAQASAMGDRGLELWPSGEGKSSQVCWLGTEGYQHLKICRVWGPAHLSAAHHVVAIGLREKERNREVESHKPRVIYRNVLPISTNPCLANGRCSINVCSC